MMLCEKIFWFYWRRHALGLYESNTMSKTLLNYANAVNNKIRKNKCNETDIDLVLFNGIQYKYSHQTFLPV